MSAFRKVWRWIHVRLAAAKRQRQSDARVLENLRARIGEPLTSEQARAIVDGVMAASPVSAKPRALRPAAKFQMKLVIVCRNEKPIGSYGCN